jgi:hypothetical protein
MQISAWVMALAAQSLSTSKTEMAIPTTLKRRRTLQRRIASWLRSSTISRNREPIY